MRAYPAPAPLFTAAPQVVGLDEYTQNRLDDLVTVWSKRRWRNQVRQQYLDLKRPVESLGISVPEEIAEGLEIVVDWPEKAVYSLANLCQWDGVISADGKDDPFDLDGVLTQNRFDVEIPQTIASELTDSCAFISTLHGRPGTDDPEVVIMSHSAAWATGIWDRRTRSLSSALTIDEVDDLERPTQMTIYLPDEWVVIEAPNGNASGTWAIIDHRLHGLNRVPVELLPFRPTLDRPFGRSRINRRVMTITDRAVRAALRMDVSSEIYTAPGLLLRGISEEAWQDIAKSWTWKLGTVKAVTRDEDGTYPEATQLPQQTMQPFIDQMRELAAEFSGASNVPLSDLGIVQDNPSSAEAMATAKENLVIEATNANKINGYALARVYQNIVMLRDGAGEVSDELSGVSTRWRNPSMPSIVSQSDAMVKQISAIPDLAKTDVALEQMGYTSEDIVRIKAQIKTAKAREALDALVSGVNQNAQQPPQQPPQAQQQAAQTPAEEE
jgi:hypothetical protein